ncbi:MAG: TIR domain-containing protein, partial [Anaerolineales bacterium]|nr:TIR domain-containing protein [Anaerolineales bacterium]
MAGKIFMSYSRRELGFVDDLVSKLEDKGYDVWLDYRVLIPGSPWKEQIEKGLNESDTVLLVVSKASLASKYVALEWQHFLEMKKRLILLIFEAVDIPAELEKYEWIDFRGSYKAGLAELFSQLEKPIQEDHPVPQAGFKMPWQVWGTIALSVIVAFVSLGAFWTIFIPFILVPLPYQIFKRKFDFMRVQAALATLPIALSLAALVYIEDIDITEALINGFEFGILGWILLAVLRSAPLQRWGKPEATVPKFANPYNPNIMNPEPIPFFIDYAPEDSKIADEMSTMLKKYGHPQAEDIKSAKAVLALVSRFKNDTEADPVRQVVFPVMIQGNDDISKKLSNVQWIDFRPGVKGLN